MVPVSLRGVTENEVRQLGDMTTLLEEVDTMARQNNLHAKALRSLDKDEVAAFQDGVHNMRQPSCTRTATLQSLFIDESDLSPPQVQRNSNWAKVAACG